MWLLYAFAGPVLWGISTHIDKYLVERYFKHSSTTVLMVFTALIGLLMLPFIWYFVPNVMNLPLPSIAVMAVSGIFYMGSMLFYLQALQIEEASAVAPLFQLSPIFGYALAYVFLGETLTHMQLFGGILVMLGTILLSFDTSFHFRVIKGRFLLLMLACTFVLALSSVVFKFYAIQDELEYDVLDLRRRSALRCRHIMYPDVFQAVQTSATKKYRRGLGRKCGK